MKQPITIAEALHSKQLFGPHFPRPSWNRWIAILKAAFGKSLTPDELVLFREVAERDPPKKKVRELVCCVGRGGGKDSVATMLAAYTAISFNPKGKLRPGEKAVVMLLAVDKDQASRVAFSYIKGLFEIPALAKLVLSITADSIELNNNVTIEVHANSYRSVRGRSIICAIMDEVSFWRDENSATPDIEVATAVGPGLGRMTNSMCILISSVHKRSGLMHDQWKRCYGKDDPNVLVIKGTTPQFNPLFDQQVIADALERDPQLNAAEYLSIWRDDLAAFIDPDAVAAAVVFGRYELPKMAGVQYMGFSDAAGGSGGDSFTAAVAFLDQGKAVLAAVREIRPPFSPKSTIEELSGFFRSYGVSKINADRYAAEFPVEQFRKHGITCEPSERFKSDLYRELLPLLNSGKIELLDNKRLISQLTSLERKTSRNDKDSIDHPAGQHDDVINAAAGCLVAVSGSMNKAEQWARFNRNAPVSIAPTQSLPTSAYAFAAELQRTNVF